MVTCPPLPCLVVPCMFMVNNLILIDVNHCMGRILRLRSFVTKFHLSTGTPGHGKGEGRAGEGERTS